jgi:hypothetical protein
MARHRPVSTQTCGVPREVFEGFDFASAREEIRRSSEERVESHPASLEATNGDVGTCEGIRISVNKYLCHLFLIC